MGGSSEVLEFGPEVAWRAVAWRGVPWRGVRWRGVPCATRFGMGFTLRDGLHPIPKRGSHPESKVGWGLVGWTRTRRRDGTGLDWTG
ncbi:hypothetical protein C5C19_16420 [Pseudoclavibacter sp. RFBH5]|nr:hypothetical protein C5C19_16420 [Pseudoclavibacter sp. RFBH5]